MPARSGIGFSRRGVGVVSALLALAAAVAPIGAGASADTTADKYAEAARIQSQLADLGQRIDTLSGQVDDARARAATAATRLSDLEQHEQAADDRLAGARARLQAVAVEAYVHQSPPALLSHILEHGLEGPGGAAYVDTAVDAQRRAIASYQAARTDLDRLHSDLETARRSAETDSADANSARQQAEAAMDAQKALLDQVKGELADLVAAEAARKAAAAAAAATKAPPTALPTGTALTPTSSTATAAGRQAGAARSNTPPPAATVTVVPPDPGAPPGSAVPPGTAARFVTVRVFATQYNPLTPGSVEVAVPDKCAKFAALGSTANLSRYDCPSAYAVGGDYRVLIQRDSGQTATIPVKDVGPWNIDDNYWAPAGSPRPRRMFATLPQGKPMSQAGFYDHFNSTPNCQNLDGTPSGRPGASDQFGRCVLNPAGIDLSPAAAAQLGLAPFKNEWVTVTFLWEPKV